MSASSIVRFRTSLGDIDVRLFGAATPASVDNFLDLIDTATFQDTLISRSVPGFVIQGGGFRLINNNQQIAVAPGPPVENLVPDSQGFLTGILNEPGLANIRGTIAFARSDEVDSATNQFFFNVTDNRGPSPDEIDPSVFPPQPLGLDFQNGGFTAFGQVLSGIDVVDEIAALPAADLSSALGSLAFTDTPLIDVDDINEDGRITGIDTVGSPISLANFFSLGITRTTFDAADNNLDGVVNAADFNLFQSQFGNSLHISDLDSNSGIGTALDSDANGDAVISAADFTSFRDGISSATFPPGDLNRDGSVTPADFNIFQADFGLTGRQNADGNSDGIVNQVDFPIFRDAVTSVAGAVAPATAFAVPEPTTLAGVATFLVIAGLRRRQ